MIATNAIRQAIDKLHLLVFMRGLRSAFFGRLILVGADSHAPSYQFTLYQLALSFCQLKDRTVNSLISVHILQRQGVVLLVGEETDDSATPKWSRRLAQCHRQAADLLTLPAQKDIPNRCDLHFCARPAVLLKLQRISLNGQCPSAVIPRVRKSQQMSRPSAEWCSRVSSLTCLLCWRSQAEANQYSREPQSVASVRLVSRAVTA